MIEKITEEELEFCETWFTDGLIEGLFSNFDNLGMFKEELGEIRLYQKFMAPTEYSIDWDATAKHNDLKEDEIFEMRQRVGNTYSLGARRYGKSVFLRIAVTISALLDDAWQTCLFSIDEKRIMGILDYAKKAFTFHPIVKLWNVKGKDKPHIKYSSQENAWELLGVNLNLKGKSPGENFYQIHAKRMFGEEVSFETEEVYEARREAVSELGSIHYFAGMTNMVKHSPAGRLFDREKENIINYPQFVNPYWNETQKKQRLEECGGESSLTYKVFVKGEIIEDGTSALNMALIREKCYQKNTIKSFEISRDDSNHFKDYIVVERPKNADCIMIAGDVADASTTEIGIFGEFGEEYKYLYRITLQGFNLDKHYEVFKFLIFQLGSEIVGIDCGDALGRSLCDKLENIILPKNIIRYAGNEKLDVGIEKDEKGNIKYEKGLPVYRREAMAEWSVEHLKKLLYSGKIQIPYDYKLDNQFSYVIRSAGKSRTSIYSCVSSLGDHAFDMFKVFSIMQFICRDWAGVEPVKSEETGGFFVL